MPSATTIATCPKCGATITDQHSYRWCPKCGEALPAQIIACLPKVQAARAASRAPQPSAQAGPRYAGFSSRVGSLLLDFVIVLPIGALAAWGSSEFRLFNLYYFLPSTLFGLFYSVYLVRRYGGTPGKLVVGIRIRKLNGDSVGYREAFLRYSVDFIFGVVMSVGLLFALLHMSDAEYHSLSIVERSKRTLELAPPWYKPVQWTQTVWALSELIVLLTNRKRRAIHDFIAGTVVVHAPPTASPGDEGNR